MNKHPTQKLSARLAGDFQDFDESYERTDNPFLTYSDDALDELFSLLNKLPSPLKERAFVTFCLLHSRRTDLVQ